MDFKLISEYKPTGDQPDAIRQLTNGITADVKHQTLLGVTGSGKTFTIANVIEKVNRPVLVLSHNKTLAAQLYQEFKEFFPNNAVEYFISYYDYYQPEAYLPTTDTYIEKDLAINDEIEKLRLSATSSLLSGRRDVIVVCSISCIYGIGNPENFHNNTISISVGDKIIRDKLLRRLVDSLYSRSDIDLRRGTFRVKGDTVDVYISNADMIVRILFWDDEIEKIQFIDPITQMRFDEVNSTKIFPANMFVASKDTIQEAIYEIQADLVTQVEFFKSIEKYDEAKRLEGRVNFDIEMIQELGHCSGIENYSLYFDRRKSGERPFCLIDCFPEDFLLIVDESHVTIPQINAMFGGDHSRKQNLVEYGFRLPSAFDNRPLKFDEFFKLIDQVIYVSATPAAFELAKSSGVVVEQVIRPTGLLDPIIEIRSSKNQIDDLMNEINIRAEKEERILVTTLTKRMAEELTKYLTKYGIRCRYIHSDVETLERIEILADLRAGKFDVLIGVNLLREGLDLPEVSLVAIIDADKEGFLRSERSLTQTSGRAARHINGKVIMYADKITGSMQRTIDENNRHREKQLKYNSENNIIPTQIIKSKREAIVNHQKTVEYYYEPSSDIDVAADPIVKYMTKSDLQKLIKKTKKQMENAAAKQDYLEAARLRDELYAYEKLYDK
ncbi:MAG: excinuclease ABC subunit UvrB [Bacteroidales bacterium]|jgi:excinuclease ABC subunit B|nr:excinuclease ABC subunit UvrB [Bacteroidales bacterium]